MFQTCWGTNKTWKLGALANLFFSFYPIFCSNNFETLPLIFGA